MKKIFLILCLYTFAIPAFADTLTNTGLVATSVSVNGTVSANFFVGNGSLLSNLPASSVSTNVVTTNYLAGGVSINGTLAANNLQIATGNNRGKINFGLGGNLYIVATGNTQDGTFDSAGFLFRLPSGGNAVFTDGTEVHAVGANFVGLEDKRQFAYNFSTGGDAVRSGERGVMSLKVADDSASEKTSFISFHKENNIEIGSISGQPGANLANAQIGVKFESSGADYAEYLYRLNKNEVIKGGDIVGVFEGKISKKTAGANRIMVVSSQPIVLGNWKGKEEAHLVHPVAFIGQVPVQIRGAVKAGDYIIPSGKDDGIGIAVSPENLTSDQAGQIIGESWESISNQGLHYVNVAVLPLTLFFNDPESEDLAKRVDELKIEIEKLKKTK